MLSNYLQAARNVVQARQARPGVAVHVRLGGDDNGGGEKQGGSGASRTGVASSYAVWAVTGGWVGLWLCQLGVFCCFVSGGSVAGLIPCVLFFAGNAQCASAASEQVR